MFLYAICIHLQRIVPSRKFKKYFFSSQVNWIMHATHYPYGHYHSFKMGATDIPSSHRTREREIYSVTFSLFKLFKWIRCAFITLWKSQPTKTNDESSKRFHCRRFHRHPAILQDTPPHTRMDCHFSKDFAVCFFS